MSESEVFETGALKEDGEDSVEFIDDDTEATDLPPEEDEPANDPNSTVLQDDLEDDSEDEN
jgi:hypothetical protein